MASNNYNGDESKFFYSQETDLPNGFKTDSKGRPTRKLLALRKWKCRIKS